MENIVSMMLSISWVVFALWIGFQTTAVYEWAALFPVLFRTNEYAEARKQNFALSYKDFLLSAHGGFMIRMMACPYCVGVWMSATSCLVFGCLPWMAAVYLVAVLMYHGYVFMVERLTDE
jgi:hypothetical protein